MAQGCVFLPNRLCIGDTESRNPFLKTFLFILSASTYRIANPTAARTFPPAETSHARHDSRAAHFRTSARWIGFVVSTMTRNRPEYPPATNSVDECCKMDS